MATGNVTVMEYTIHVNSYQRQSGTNTNMNITMPQVINLLAKRGQFQIIFNSVQIPFTFYQLNNLNNLNVLSVTIRNPTDVGPWTTTITLNQGNYTPYTLATELQAELTLACATPPTGYTSFTPIFNITYDVNRGYLLFALTSPTGGSITLNFATSPNPLTAGFFGINTITPTNVVINNAGLGSSTQPCVLNPITYLLIRSSLKQFRNFEWISIPADVSDIVYKIPITTNQATWINYYQPSEPIYLIDNTIQTINFYLTNNLTYTPINLQQIPWSFSFTIREVLRPDYESLNNYHALLPSVEENTEESLKRLMEEKQKQLDKLQLYQKKLSAKLPTIKEEKPDQKEGTVPDKYHLLDY